MTKKMAKARFMNKLAVTPYHAGTMQIR